MSMHDCPMYPIVEHPEFGSDCIQLGSARPEVTYDCGDLYRTVLGFSQEGFSPSDVQGESRVGSATLYTLIRRYAALAFAEWGGTLVLVHLWETGGGSPSAENLGTAVKRVRAHCVATVHTLDMRNT